MVQPVSATEQSEYAFRLRHETLRSLLDKNGSALEILSDLEADLNHLRRSDARIRRPVRRLIDEALLMAQELNLLAGDRYTELYRVLLGIQSEVDTALRDDPEGRARALVVTLDSEESLDEGLVGGKSAGLARLRGYCPDSVAAGFTITTAAYDRFLAESDLHDRIRLLLTHLEVATDGDLVRSRSETIRGWIQDAELPPAIREAIREGVQSLPEVGPSGWAVRSSATSEDGRHSFAGQFDSKLGVAADQLEHAYLEVLASRFSTRAVKYRLHGGLREIDTPMAVLFMPLTDARAAGVAYTLDPQRAEPRQMLVNAVPGLGDALVRGTVRADTFRLSRESEPRVLETIPASGGAGKEFRPEYLSEQSLLEVGALAFRASEAMGHELDIEWAVDDAGKVWLLQGRRLRPATQEAIRERRRREARPLFEDGITIFPGRAEGPVVFLPEESGLGDVPRGAVVIVNQPRPELAAVLPRIAALLVEEGNPIGHLATLVREFAVPCLFRVGNRVRRLLNQKVVSVDAAGRKIYAGSRWPGIRERVLARIASASQRPHSGPLYELVLALNLTDPDASDFKPSACRSIHDGLRFMHEMAVRTMFKLGDRQRRGLRLATKLPLKLSLIDLDGCLPAQKGSVEPEAVASGPFRALWRGISDPRLSWPDRWQRELRGVPADFREQVLGGTRGPRRAGTANYAIVSRDYLNLNARLAYHYLMLDAIVGPGEKNNHVHFRFRGGGAGDERRARRARFLQHVLRQNGFGVERKGDLVTAWLRRHPQAVSERALEMLGRLLVCARQLDPLMRSDADEKLFTERFLDEDYRVFS